MILIIFSVSIFILDQITKYFIYSNMKLGDSISVLGDFFRITFTRNYGGAFSILSNMSSNFRTPFFLAVSILTIILIIVFYKKIVKTSKSAEVSFGLILGGAFGNLIDRIRWGNIVDFLDFGISSNVRWPVFNVADSSICIGVAILFVLMMRNK